MMIERIQIELQVDSDARSHSGSPYLEHEDFIKYCKANGVYANAEALEAYEKKGLLYPCFRLLYPSELLRRRFKATLPGGNGQYHYRDAWAPLIKLENAVLLSQEWRTKEFEQAMVAGHPLENAFADGVPFIVNPHEEKYRAWSRYNVVEGSDDNIRSKKSRATHYYSTWKMFYLDELNISNTIRHNRATGQRTRSWFRRNELHHCTLNEYSPYLKSVAIFAYRYNLFLVNYLENSRQTKADQREVLEKSQQFAKTLVKDADYTKWIRLLRRLIELHENYSEGVQLLICEEVKRYISRTVHLMMLVTGFDFNRICADVSGHFVNSLGRGHEDGVSIYPRKLEELLADEKWDLEQNVGRYFPKDLKKFNETLLDSEKIPEMLSEQLFDELVKEPRKTPLAAIRKMNRSLNSNGLYTYEEKWSGVCDLATSIEVHGKEWLGGKKLEDVFGKLCSRFSVNYGCLKTSTGIPNATDANDAADFIDKLTRIRSSPNIPVDKRCGRHLLIAHLVRNYTSHQKGLTDKILRENLGNIYSALINTLFVLYAAYKKQ